MKNNAFNHLIYKQKDSLQNIAIHFTRNFDDANYLVQETMLKAIRYSKLYQEGTYLRGWLYTIMKHTLLNKYSNTSNHKSVHETSEDLNSLQLLLNASDHSVVHEFVREDIFKALAKLPSDNYIPFIKYFEGFKYQEIADELAIPVDTVKTRIYVARQLLKKNLKMYHREFERSAPQTKL